MTAEQHRAEVARREAERAARMSEAKLRGLFDNLLALIIEVDREGVIRFANRGIVDASPDELIGQSAFSFIAADHQEVARSAFREMLVSRELRSVEVRDIFGSWWYTRLVPVIEDGVVQSALVLHTDVTEHYRNIWALQRERKLLRQLLDLHERERQMIAYEIHDAVAQNLAAALYGLEACRGLQPSSSPDAERAYQHVLKLLGQGLAESRRLISGLRPPILDEMGIVAAIEYLIREWEQRSAARIEFLHDVGFDRLAGPLESAVFRIVQESLANACRHSDSPRIRIELCQAARRIKINVRDWGKGFDPTSVQENCFGLRGIRERGRLLDGSVTIVTAPGAGTQVAVELPLVERADHEPA